MSLPFVNTALLNNKAVKRFWWNCNGQQTLHLIQMSSMIWPHTDNVWHRARIGWFSV